LAGPVKVMGNRVVMMLKATFVVAFVTAIPCGIGHELYFGAIWKGGAGSPTSAPMVELRNHEDVRYVAAAQKRNLGRWMTAGVSATAVMMFAGAGLLVVDKRAFPPSAAEERRRE
jgi:hypothetical protein